MKTAISIPDELFDSAEALAARLGVSRSQLYATAVAHFVAQQERANITARLDAVYSTLDDAADRRAVARLQAHTVRAADSASSGHGPDDRW